ncbi:hypothetical protein EAI_05326 [Harpegnathos saltator]|uniref:Uncharacterized protein n=1 Tax=Harpegnathos saltator TaxID=610380 RepID=E2BL59_HARSA|nr:hypothetical protein EAI_05326 [Harpegnathos saltator]
MPLKDFSGNPFHAVAERSQWCTARTPNGTLCDGRLLRDKRTQTAAGQCDYAYLRALFLPINQVPSRASGHVLSFMRNSKGARTRPSRTSVADLNCDIEFYGCVSECILHRPRSIYQSGARFSGKSSNVVQLLSLLNAANAKSAKISILSDITSRL